ncbi:uncharacterized protein LOC127277018, partial [Leptopilina boulardi]|uniref:uncharacterized protein LOC127277018 n=1 Tax=Leptopilina boulardi TaxID=63433 RepID=UPI0021F56018
MSVNEVDTARQSRTNCKSKLTKFNTFLEKCSIDENAGTVEEIKLRLQKIEEVWSEFEKAQLTLEILAPAPSRDLDRTEFENYYFKYVSKATKMIKERTDHETVTENDELTRQRVQIDQLQAELNAQREAELTHLRTLASSRSNIIENENSHNGIRYPLPKLDLPTFSGGYEEWLGFKDLFQAIIHKDNNIPKVQKFRYLKSYLRESASRIIENIEISEANYEVAWGLLEERYNNKRVIIQNHMTALLELTIPNKDSASGLRNLLDTILRHIRALKMLGEPTESWDTPLVCFLVLKLDRESRKEWERSVKGSEMPRLENLTNFLRERCQILEALNPETNDNKNKMTSSINKNSFIEKKNNGKTLLNTQSSFKCILCNQDHMIHNCSDFLKLNISDRYQIVKKKGLCFNCLRGNHLINECKSRNCNLCHKRHHTLLHTQSNQNSNVEIVNHNQGKSMHLSDSSKVLLSTAIVNLVDSKGNRINCRILLDSGSQPNIMTDKFAKILNLKRRKLRSAIEVLNSNEVNSGDWVETKMESQVSNYAVDVSFLILPNITGELPANPINKNQLKIPSYIKLADPQFHQPATVDALIGAELFYEILGYNKIPLAVPHTSLLSTKVGWIVIGKLGEITKTQKITCNLIRDDLSVQLEKFWKIEEGEQKKFLSLEEKSCEEHFVNNVTRDNKGKYIVRLPFNENKNNLGNSYEIARKRFFMLERKLSKDPKLKQKYTNFMEEYEHLNHMKQIIADKSEGYYLPHQAVLKMIDNISKFRVVFDASCQTDTGLSLNDTLMTGPTIQDNIVALMLRFRQHVIALSGDIEKMYRQFFIHPQDRKFQKILWRYNENEPIRTYELNTVTYGTSAAPFLAIRCLKELANNEGRAFPIAAEVLKNDFYVDDCLTGADTVSEVQQIKEGLIELTTKAGLRICKWRSNHQEIAQNSGDSEVLTNDVDQSSKTLGVMWNSQKDTLHFNVQPTLDQKPTTKRIMLSQIGKMLYDPLGLMSPVTVVAKIKMQELWKTNNSWDDPIPTKLLVEFEQFQGQLGELSNWEIERAVRSQPSDETQIHGFADASQKAYGACVYIRCSNEGKHRTILLCAKSKVAPLKTVTLPRLELCAAVLLSKLIITVKNAIKFNVNAIHLWSDSTIVLNWIASSPHEFSTFIANRIAEIQTLTRPECWKHVISQDNPADFVSRGQMPAEFVSNKLWKNGPTWLELSEENWPSHHFIQTELPERKKSVALTIKNVKTSINLWSRFSSLRKLIHVVAYCLRIAERARGKTKFSEILTPAEIQSAFNRIVSLVQMEEFYNEINQLSKNECLSSRSKILRLNPVMHEEILRVGGRIKRAELPYDQRHPMLLPKNHPVTELIIRDIHEQNMHAGNNATLYALRMKFWPIDGRLAVRKVINKCVKCFRAQPKEVSYQMGNLPAVRVTATRVFENTGARNELSDLYRLLNTDEHNKIISRKLADQNIEWYFSPPRTPHFGGIWEAAVKSLKHHLRRTIGETLLTFEELGTYMCEIEAIVNSRPLTPMTMDPNDVSVLTPGHFLIGEPLTTIPAWDYTQTPVNRLSRWECLQKMKRDLWKRWSREYLNELNVRSKWHSGSPEVIKEGTLVILRDDNLPPLRWSLGRVSQIYPGDDGVIRVVK